MYIKKSVTASNDDRKKKPQVLLHLFLLHEVTREMKISAVLGFATHNKVLLLYTLNGFI